MENNSWHAACQIDKHVRALTQSLSTKKVCILYIWFVTWNVVKTVFSHKSIVIKNFEPKSLPCSLTVHLHRYSCIKLNILDNRLKHPLFSWCFRCTAIQCICHQAESEFITGFLNLLLISYRPSEKDKNFMKKKSVV